MQELPKTQSRAVIGQLQFHTVKDVAQILRRISSDKIVCVYNHSKDGWLIVLYIPEDYVVSYQYCDPSIIVQIIPSTLHYLSNSHVMFVLLKWA